MLLVCVGGHYFNYKVLRERCDITKGLSGLQVEPRGSMESTLFARLENGTGHLNSLEGKKKMKPVAHMPLFKRTVDEYSF